jgi:tetratricopeptide (TPR) repeat protein
LSPDPATYDRAEVEAALHDAREGLREGDLAGSRAAADRALELLDTTAEAGELRAQAVLLRASSDDDRIVPDAPLLAWAGDVLAGAALWQDAMRAYFLLAREAEARDDPGAERRWLSSALGAAEAGGSVIYAPNLLRRLALLELRRGHAQRAGELASRAFERLRQVPSLNARLAEAECLETMGDAWAALGDRGQALHCWRDAMERQRRLERHGAVDALRTRIDGGPL